MRFKKNDFCFPEPDKTDHTGPYWEQETLYEFLACELNLETGSLLTRKVKMIKPDFDAAMELADATTSMFMKSIDELKKSETAMQDTAKRASGNIRKAADDLSSGLLKMQKQADFNSLEKYTVLLERAAAAMTTLADLEKSGRLEKIAAAIK